MIFFERILIKCINVKLNVRYLIIYFFIIIGSTYYDSIDEFISFVIKNIFYY